MVRLTFKEPHPVLGCIPVEDGHGNHLGSLDSMTFPHKEGTVRIHYPDQDLRHSLGIEDTVEMVPFSCDLQDMKDQLAEWTEEEDE